jgi:hypothetical protein
MGFLEIMIPQNFNVRSCHLAFYAECIYREGMGLASPSAQPRALTDQGSRGHREPRPSLAPYTMKQPLALVSRTLTRDFGPTTSDLAHRLVILAQRPAISHTDS